MEEFKQDFAYASAEISSQLPGARLVKYEDVHFSAGYALISDFADRLNRETEFLMKAIPLITHRIVSSNLSNTRSKVLELADSLDLKGNSLALVAVLSCVYEAKDGLDHFVLDTAQQIKLRHADPRLHFDDFA